MTDVIVGFRNNKETPTVIECKTDFEILYTLLHLDADIKEVTLLLNAKVIGEKELV